MRLVTLLAALLALLPVPSAAAEPLLVVDRGGVRAVDDPFLPPRGADGMAALAGAAPRPGAHSARARGPSVRLVLRESLLAGRLTRADHDRYRALYLEARVVRRRLQGARRAELQSVIATLEYLAGARRLTEQRMTSMFLILRRNTQFWRLRPFPVAAARVAFAGSQLLFEYYPGRGLQLQPLHAFGKANALYNACVGENTRPGVPCRRGALRQLLDELAGLGVDRGGFIAWEYYFATGGGRPPWISGLAQGTAIQALSRGAALLGEPAYLELGRAALGAFENAPPLGVRVPADGGAHYLLYSFNSRLRVLNGQLQAVTGLYDFAAATQDPRALALFQAGELAARAAVPRHDTGAWSLYADPGAESNLNYHRLVRDFLRNLCTRTRTPVYCDTAVRFTRYLEEQPELELIGVRGGRARAGRAVAVRFRLSKLSRVSLRITTRDGRDAYYNRLLVGYGNRAFDWTPPRPGRYALRLEAADLRNHHVVRRGSLVVARARRR